MGQQDSSPTGGTIHDDGAGGTYGVQRNWRDSESPTYSVVEAVATVTGTEPDNMRPLYDVIDPDALDQLFDPTRGSSRRSRGAHVTFRFGGCDVAVYADGRTIVSPGHDDQP